MNKEFLNNKKKCGLDGVAQRSLNCDNNKRLPVVPGSIKYNPVFPSFFSGGKNQNMNINSVSVQLLTTKQLIMPHRQGVRAAIFSIIFNIMAHTGPFVSFILLYYVYNVLLN